MFLLNKSECHINDFIKRTKCGSWDSCTYQIAEEFVLKWKELFIFGQIRASLLKHQHKIFRRHTSPGVASPLNEAERRPSHVGRPWLPWELVKQGSEKSASQKKLWPICFLWHVSPVFTVCWHSARPSKFFFGKWGGKSRWQELTPNLAAESEPWMTSGRVACFFWHITWTVVQSEGECRVVVFFIFEPVPMRNPPRWWCHVLVIVPQNLRASRLQVPAVVNPSLRCHSSLGKAVEPLSLVTLSLFFRIVSSWTNLRRWKVGWWRQEDKPVPPGSPHIFSLFPAVCFQVPRHVERREAVAEAAWAGVVTWKRRRGSEEHSWQLAQT